MVPVGPARPASRSGGPRGGARGDGPARVRHSAPWRLSPRPSGKGPTRGSQERRQDMSDLSEVRPEVVEAILGVLKGGDPAELPPGATSEEKAAAKDAYLSEFLAERGKRDRQSHAWELLLTRSYDEAPSW